MVVSKARGGAIIYCCSGGFIQILVILANYSLKGIALLGPDAGMLLIQLVFLPVDADLIADFDGWTASIVESLFR